MARSASRAICRTAARSSIGETVGDENGCVWARYDDNPSVARGRRRVPGRESNGSSISAGVQKPTRRWLDARRGRRLRGLTARAASTVCGPPTASSCSWVAARGVISGRVPSARRCSSATTRRTCHAHDRRHQRLRGARATATCTSSPTCSTTPGTSRPAASASSPASISAARC